MVWLNTWRIGVGMRRNALRLLTPYEFVAMLVDIACYGL